MVSTGRSIDVSIKKSVSLIVDPLLMATICCLLGNITNFLCRNSLAISFSFNSRSFSKINKFQKNMIRLPI